MIEQLRNQIDEIDEGLVALLQWRYNLAGHILKLKEEEGLPAKSPEREEEILDNVRDKAEDVDIPTDHVLDLFKRILSNSANR